jgi:hypothetical protein
MDFDGKERDWKGWGRAGVSGSRGGKSKRWCVNESKEGQEPMLSYEYLMSDQQIIAKPPHHEKGGFSSTENSSQV